MPSIRYCRQYALEYAVRETKHARKALAIKVSESEAEGLRRIAVASGKTVTRVLLDGAKSEAELAAVQSELRALRMKYEEATGRRPDLRRRVSVPLTEAEYQAAREAAFREGVSLPRLLRSVMARKRTLPAIGAGEY